MASLHFQSAYSTDLPWYRGNLHTHTTKSDGDRDPQVVVDDYADRGYDFLMISDHDLVTALDGLDAQGMVLIPGNEVTANGPHLLHVNAERRVAPREDRQEVLDDIGRNDASLSILAHPNWHRTYSHYDQLVMEGLEGYVGIEIYNGVIERLPGSALATDRWDQLLSNGRRVWGFAHDDSHRDEDVELGWNVVQAGARSVSGLVDAMRRGAFYASTGVKLAKIEVVGDEISIEATTAVSWRVVRDWGRVVHRSRGHQMTWAAPPNFGGDHVRVEAWGEFGSCAWTQPFFVAR